MYIYPSLYIYLYPNLCVYIYIWRYIYQCVHTYTVVTASDPQADPGGSVFESGTGKLPIVFNRVERLGGEQWRSLADGKVEQTGLLPDVRHQAP